MDALIVAVRFYLKGNCRYPPGSNFSYSEGASGKFHDYIQSPHKNAHGSSRCVSFRLSRPQSDSTNHVAVFAKCSRKITRCIHLVLGNSLVCDLKPGSQSKPRTSYFPKGIAAGPAQVKTPVISTTDQTFSPPSLRASYNPTPEPAFNPAGLFTCEMDNSSNIPTKASNFGNFCHFHMTTI